MSERIFKVPTLPGRSPDAHKGDFGRALLIGGSRGMTGAISLAGLACLRSGAGLVTLAVPETCLSVVSCFNPCYMTLGLPADDEGRLAGLAEKPLMEAAAHVTALALGPGLGRSEEITSLCRNIYREVHQPLVVDADAINALAAVESRLSNPGGSRIITPHPGEFERLSQASASDRGNQMLAARQLAKQHGIVIVLKGSETFVTCGDRFYLNDTGNPGMATGGSGDVLTGVITALLCQGLKPFEAACLGVHVHGLAGDLAAQELGQIGMIAADIVHHLPAAFRANQGG